MDMNIVLTTTHILFIVGHFYYIHNHEHDFSCLCLIYVLPFLSLLLSPLLPFSSFSPLLLPPSRHLFCSRLHQPTSKIVSTANNLQPKPSASSEEPKVPVASHAHVQLLKVNVCYRAITCIFVHIKECNNLYLLSIA